MAIERVDSVHSDRFPILKRLGASFSTIHVPTLHSEMMNNMMRRQIIADVGDQIEHLTQLNAHIEIARSTGNSQFLDPSFYFKDILQHLIRERELSGQMMEQESVPVLVDKRITTLNNRDTLNINRGKQYLLPHKKENQAYISRMILYKVLPSVTSVSELEKSLPNNMRFATLEEVIAYARENARFAGIPTRMYAAGSRQRGEDSSYNLIPFIEKGEEGSLKTGNTLDIFQPLPSTMLTCLYKQSKLKNVS
jgi:hypothetical protein